MRLIQHVRTGDGWSRAAHLDAPAGIELPDAAARNLWRFRIGVIREARNRLDPSGESSPMGSSELREIVARAAVLSGTRFGFGPLADSEARAFAAEVVDEAVRLVERDAIEQAAPLAEYCEPSPDGDSRAPSSRFTFVDDTALEQQPPIAWQIDGMVPAASLGGLVGPYDTYKSFVAVDAVCSIASGLPFLRRFPTAKGPRSVTCARAASPSRSRAVIACACGLELRVRVREDVPRRCPNPKCGAVW